MQPRDFPAKTGDRESDPDACHAVAAKRARAPIPGVRYLARGWRRNALQPGQLQSGKQKATLTPGGTCWMMAGLFVATWGLGHASEPLRKTAEQGDGVAQYEVGLMYFNGQGVPIDLVEAARWYSKAAERGHSKAESRLRVLFDVGLRVPRDYAEAVEWYRKAADTGEMNARFRVPATSRKARRVAEAQVAAARWFHKAAQQGLSEAQHLLGSMFATGEGAPLDYAVAFQWYREAAEQGYVYSQRNVGYMYATGKGVPQNYVQAYKWYSLAGSQMSGEDREKALKARVVLSRALTPAQIAKAHRSAREWKPKRARGPGGLATCPNSPDWSQGDAISRSTALKASGLPECRACACPSCSCPGLRSVAVASR